MGSTERLWAASRAALASVLAIVLVLVFMGMMAPASIVFVIAFAPIAFALTCAGAWLGSGG